MFSNFTDGQQTHSIPLFVSDFSFSSSCLLSFSYDNDTNKENSSALSLSLSLSLSIGVEFSRSLLRLPFFSSRSSRFPYLLFFFLLLFLFSSFSSPIDVRLCRHSRKMFYLIILRSIFQHTRTSNSSSWCVKTALSFSLTNFINVGTDGKSYPSSNQITSIE